MDADADPDREPVDDLVALPTVVELAEELEPLVVAGGDQTLLIIRQG
jgi:hypothetical protein